MSAGLRIRRGFPGATAKPSSRCAKVTTTIGLPARARRTNGTLKSRASSSKRCAPATCASPRPRLARAASLEAGIQQTLCPVQRSATCPQSTARPGSHPVSNTLASTASRGRRSRSRPWTSTASAAVMTARGSSRRRGCAIQRPATLPASARRDPRAGDASPERITSPSSRSQKRSSTRQPRVRARFSAMAVEGWARPASSALRVCRLIPARAATSPCFRPLRWRARRRPLSSVGMHDV